MKKCLHCGEKIEDDEEFCPVCGYEVDKKEKALYKSCKYCGVTGFILGIFAFSLGGNIIMGIMAVVFSYMKIKQDRINRTKQRNAFAIAGYVSGICVIILYIVALILQFMDGSGILLYLNFQNFVLL